MSIDSTIGSRIRYVRKLNNYTTVEVADYTGLTSKFLYEVEHGHKGLSATNLQKICKALDVSCDYILMGIPETKIDKELLGIIESFDVTQISNIKKILALMLEVSKY